SEDTCAERCRTADSDLIDSRWTETGAYLADRRTPFALACMVDLWLMSPTSKRRDWLSRVVAGDPELRIAGTAATFPYLRSLMSEESADISVVQTRSGEQCP